MARAQVPEALERDLRLLLINDHSRKADTLVEEAVEEILRMHRQRGWLVMRDKDAEITIRKYLPYPIDPDAPLSPLLQIALDDCELDGILLVGQAEGDVKRVVARVLENESRNR